MLRAVNAFAAGVAMQSGRVAGILIISYASGLAFSLPASGATYHVSPLGSDAPPYATYATAAHSVADAANLATAQGDTVLVHAGSYTSTDTIYIATGVTFAGVGRDSVTLNWGGTESEPARMVSLAGDNEVFGIEFRNPLGDYWNPDISGLRTFSLGHISIHDCLFSQVYLYLDGDGTLDVFDNRFYRRQSWALFAGRSENRIIGNLFEDGGTAIQAQYAGDVEIENNIFQSDIAQTQLIALEVYLCDSVRFRNNLVYNTNWTMSWSWASGVIENNTFVRARYNWATMFVFLHPDEDLTISNNVFVDMASPIALGPPCYDCFDTSGTTSIVRNVIWPPRDSLFKPWPPNAPYSPDQISAVDSLNLYAYPMFVDDSTYCPQIGSTLINSGDPLILDVDGSRSDIGWTGGPGGITCEYAELPPSPPASLSVTGAGNLVHIAWSPRPESDLGEYRLYRGSTSGFWLHGLTPLKTLTPADTTATDTLLAAGENYYYVVTAVDTAGLESEPSVEGSYIISGVFDDPSAGPLPRSSRIVRAYPNPFNASILIEVEVSEGTGLPAKLEIGVFDVLGRLVTTRGIQQDSPGLISLEWDGKDHNARDLASGVYFIRLTINKVTADKVVPVVLMK